MPSAPYFPTHIKLWTMPENYAGAVWPAYYSAGVGQSRDSDPMERVNFRTMLAELEKVSTVEEGIQVVRESHWAVGWVEWIAISQDDTAALEVADRLKGELKDYPSLDDNALSEEEMEEAHETWKNCYNPKDRVEYIRAHRSDFDFQSLSDLLGCVRGTYFAGDASNLIY